MEVNGPPPIAPVRQGSDRPKWSVMIPTYNCASLLEPCLRSALAAAPHEATEIVVVDDQSTDDPESVVEAVGGGRVRFHRNESNLGAIGNFNRCLELSTGHRIHLLHGDDLVEPEFYELADSAFDTRPDVDFFLGRAQYITESGEPAETTRSELSPSGPWDDALKVLTVSNRVRPPAVAVRRTAYESVGGYRPDLPHAADWEMWVRLAASSGVWFEDQVVAKYRRHDGQDTAARTLDGSNLSERLDCIGLLMAYLPEDQRRRQSRLAYGYSAMFAARTALRLATSGEIKGALAQLRGSFTASAKAIRPPQPTRS